MQSSIPFVAVFVEILPRKRRVDCRCMSAHYRNLDFHSFDLNSVFLKSLNRKSSIIGAQVMELRNLVFCDFLLTKMHRPITSRQQIEWRKLYYAIALFHFAPPRFKITAPLGSGCRFSAIHDEKLETMQGILADVYRNHICFA